MHSLSYDEALAFWFGRINYELTTAHPADLNLDRMRALLGALGNPHERLRIVHVAGSKGKGSTSAMVAAILAHAGYRTGLFTSPHLGRVEERIQVNGVPISSDELVALLNTVARAESSSPTSARGQRWPATFFEVATALGFLHFVQRRVDVAVLEVGLGGRFDSTNVCQPLVALITSISFDHTRQLGNRLESIAAEKAGIVKPGRPVVSGVTAPEAAHVIDSVCRNQGAPLDRLGVEVHYRYQPGRVSPQGDRRARVQIRTRFHEWPEMELNLLGEHQAANAAVAVGCIEQLRRQGMQVPDAAVRAGLANVVWPARMEVLNRRPLVVVDCAHNVASVQALVDTLRASFPPARRWLVLAVSGDKDLKGMLEVLAPHFGHVFLTRFRNNPRSVPPEQLADLLRHDSRLPFTICADSADAWRAARAAAAHDDLVCITGSVFLAGEMRPMLV